MSSKLHIAGFLDPIGSDLQRVRPKKSPAEAGPFSRNQAHKALTFLNKPSRRAGTPLRVGAAAAAQLRPEQMPAIAAETSQPLPDAYAERSPEAVATGVRADANGQSDRAGVLHYHPRMGLYTGYRHARH